MAMEVAKYQVGSLVRTRGRDWVVRSRDDDVLLLRPLSGTESDSCGVYLPLEGHTVEPATFPLPDLEHAGEFVAGRLVREAARLSLRSGAGPFRSLGHISVRPRPYQFVPLIMALRLETVRLLIADDVGVGKTIEAGMIARELMDRGDIRRLCVLCPPHLCDQWQRELTEKFQLSPVIVRTNTIARLERDVQPQGTSIYSYYPHIVVSIDFAKLDHRKYDFLANVPDFVIVDEAHGAARPSGHADNDQQLRYSLVRGLANKPERHLVLVTATPHSGIETSFKSLLGLLTPDFEDLDLQRVGDKERVRLARHFVQRGRGDVRRWMGQDTQFPEREPLETPYPLSPEYRALFEDVRAFTRELVREPGLSRPRQRVRYWAALALLRCVMSSPAAAVRAFGARLRRERPTDEEVDEKLRQRETMDPITEEGTIDTEPDASIEAAVAETGDRAAKTLREFRRQADAIMSAGKDLKVAEATAVVSGLLRDGFRPIVYCRYIATANYVAEELQKRLRASFKDVHVLAITGETGGDEEREARLAELVGSDRHVLVATDCLSEGVNLQEHFDAVVHYDLPWNPNRLEQREGRVDRFGQRKATVRAVLMYGTGNAIDAAVLRVLIRKAREIHRRLGISVPVPVDSETVMKAVIEALFEGKSIDKRAEQLSLDFEGFPTVEEMHLEWDRRGAREAESRTRFAQHAIKADEVAEELTKLDDVLGNPDVVRRFLVEASQRLGVRLERKNDVYVVDPALLEETLRSQLGWKKPTKVVFNGRHKPEDEDAVEVGRTHPLVASLAGRILGEAFRSEGSRLFARCGASYTDAVNRRTVMALLRIRYKLSTRRGQEMFAEEIVTTGFWRKNGGLSWYEPNEPALLKLLDDMVPSANISQQERERQVRWALDAIDNAESQLSEIARRRATETETSHAKLRQYTGGGRFRATPYSPPDILGIYVLVPGGTS